MRHTTSRARLRHTALVAGALLVAASAAGTAQATTSAAGQQGSGPRITAAPADCPKGYFCGYAGANYTSPAFKFKDCYMQPVAARTGGSWYNNQSTSTKAKMYNIDKKLVFTTPGAPYGDPHGDWTGIRYIEAC
ncbi:MULTISPECIES: peptidase inhibitor family I36 protein [unclassified Kitasatospora]